METRGRASEKGQPYTLIGPQLRVGQKLPDATLVTPDMREVKLSSYFGKPLIISLVPSMDTSVCNAQTKRFNREAARLGEDVQIMTISADLPHAQRRFIQQEGVSSLTILSDYRGQPFGRSVGMFVKETYLLARAVIVVDAEGTVRYLQIVQDFSNQPDYEPALEAARSLLQTA
ncbi:MAG: thiol peroxidase [Candidatus Zixiibacteriota bacterium]|nr:MAG: thiol peroxidase [candidate division Zixibacteria bacterium]